MQRPRKTGKLMEMSKAETESLDKAFLLRHGLEPAMAENLRAVRPFYEKQEGRDLTLEEVYDLDVEIPLPEPEEEDQSQPQPPEEENMGQGVSDHLYRSDDWLPTSPQEKIGKSKD